MVAERLYQMAVSLIVGLLTARYLGPENYGVINYVAAFISFGTPLCGLGLEGVLVKRYVDQPKKAGKLVGTAMAMEFGASVLTSLAIVSIVAVSNAGSKVKIIIAILESVQLLFRSTEAIEFWYQSQLKSKYTSIIKMIAYTVMSVYRIFLLAAGKSVEWFAFSISLDMIVIGILYLSLYWRQKGPKLGISFSLGKLLLGDSYHFILSGLMVVIYSQMDKIMIQAMLGDEQTGLYSAAYTICSLWFFIPGALISSARPLIMKAKTVNQETYLYKLKQLYAGIFWMGVLVGVVVTIFGKFIILLLYGRDYMGACGALVIGIWYGIFAQLGTARGIWILSEHKNKYVKYCLMWGAIVNVILNYVLIPVWGINGASLATLTTQFVTCVVAPLFYKGTREHTLLLWQGISLQWRKRKGVL